MEEETSSENRATQKAAVVTKAMKVLPSLAASLRRFPILMVGWNSQHAVVAGLCMRFDREQSIDEHQDNIT